MPPDASAPSPLLAALLLILCVLILATAFALAVTLLHRTRRRRGAQPPLSAAPASMAATGADDVSTLVEAPEAPQQERLPYTRVPALLTRAEQEFFAVARDAVPSGWYLFPQVRLANLIHVEQRARYNKTHFYRIQAKCVDFVLCEPTGLAPQLVIELDDSSHQLAHRQARDAFVDAALASAGLPILHVAYQRRYDPTTLAQQIKAALAPAPQPGAPALRPRPGLVREAPAVALTPARAPVRWSCRQCNAVVGEHAKYCNHCGAQIAL